MDRRSKIAAIFGKIDVSKIKSCYTSSMVGSLDGNFIRFLVNLLDDNYVDTWSADPSNEDVLEDLAESGYSFYNHVYIGNPGYEWVEDYI